VYEEENSGAFKLMDWVYTLKARVCHSGVAVSLAAAASDWHGLAKPAGLPGKGHPGTGPGGNLSTLVKPVPPERVAGLPVCD
jgi:hypothetical protein